MKSHTEKLLRKVCTGCVRNPDPAERSAAEFFQAALEKAGEEFAAMKKQKSAAA